MQNGSAPIVVGTAGLGSISDWPVNVQLNYGL